MIFKKISIHLLLVFCTIKTGESCHHSRYHTCGCSSKTKPDNTGEPNPNIQYKNKLDEVNKKYNTLFTTTIGDYQSSIPLEYHQPDITSYYGNIHLNPLSYSTDNDGPQEASDLNEHPYLTEAILKQMWLSHQLGNANIPNQDQNEIYYTESPQITPLINVINKPGEQQDSDLNGSRFLSQSLLELQFRANYDNGTSNSKEDQNNNRASDYNRNENNGYQSRVMSLGASLEELNFPHYNDIKNSGKQQSNILPPQITPFVEYAVDKQQDDHPAHTKPYENVLNNIPYEYYSKLIPNTKLKFKNSELNNINKQQEKYPLRAQMYENIDYNVPNTYYTELVPEKTFRNKNYYVTKLDNQQNDLPIYRQTDRNGNLDYNMPYKYDSNNEQRYPIPATHIAPNRMPPTQQEPNKLSKWVSEQIEMLNNKNQDADKVDLTGLGYSVIQILSENGMYITDNGMLIDTYGTIFDIQTLNLTPIIIGNTMSLRHILEGKYGVMSSKLQPPYLHAILVSVSHPLKILGIMLFGKMNLPLSTPTGVTNDWGSIYKVPKSAKSGSDEAVNDEAVHKTEQKQNKPEKPKDNKDNKSNRDDGDAKYAGQSSNYVNINGNNNSLGRSRLHKKFTSLRGRPEENTNDNRPYSKEFKFIDQEELESDGGRLFVPHIELQEQPIDILIGRHNLPVALPSKYLDSSRIHMPSLSSILGIKLRSKNVPVNNVKSIQNNVAAEISKESSAISGAIGKFSIPTEALQNLNLLKKDIPVGGQTVPSGRLQIVNDDAKQTIGNKQGLHTIPLDYTDVDVAQNILHSINPFEKLDIGSRSGVQLVVPDIPPDVHDGNNAFDLVENYDDDDGDFRIIGGNAATGSGTPLSNKGRSGYVI